MDATVTVEVPITFRRDLLPKLPSFIRRVCSGYAPMWGVLRTQSA